MEKRFQVECDDCSFDRTVEGRQPAERTAHTHASTGHDVVVVELPPALADS